MDNLEEGSLVAAAQLGEQRLISRRLISVPK
jgi:hypothetical protein